MIARLAAVVVAAAVAGCADRPALLGETVPAYLGAGMTSVPSESFFDVRRVSPSKVLSANVFERVTGRPVDPARLIGP